ncbi:MmcQ/YjbR family DNA-binding protein [Dyadobacter psychrotolerans]|uniref:MmcQ/YjbR family DNA-binding protein n=1 Tax=Dyadobacter psychrotolerans TaxID=2541721 RepID=A0A4R5DT33_9BACT|nr:MmcQ/YjbR family DNA-binding protein [Dyadobacter psychrotolerans]TDE15534.1 MmcQ/YjbR family DNA-binding protein [Dyadobacter psychrotolerans]
MNLDTLRDYCLELPGVTEELPFGPDTLVFKVMGKMFLLTSLDDSPLSFNVKCDPEKAEELRTEYEDVLPGYHMSKKHWNTVKVTGSIPGELLFGWVKDSYELVANSLTKALKLELEKLKSGQ